MSSHLTSCSKSEKSNALDMLERETRRERILENRAKSIKVAEKQAAMKQKRKDEDCNNYTDDKIDLSKTEDVFFETIRKLKMKRENRSAPTNLLSR